jgi:hypothetical protein
MKVIAMPKLSQAVIDKIQSEAEHITYGKVTVVINENMPDVDIVIEKRSKLPKQITPGPGKMVVKSAVRQG